MYHSRSFSECIKLKSITFARSVLKNINPNSWHTDILYLIDGSVAKEQLLRSRGAEWVENYWTGEIEWYLPGIKVMTYSEFCCLSYFNIESLKGAESLTQSEKEKAAAFYRKRY